MEPPTYGISSKKYFSTLLTFISAGDIINISVGDISINYIKEVILCKTKH